MSGDGGPRPKSDLRLRVLSALVLVPVALGLAFVGGLPFTLLVALVCGLIMIEWLAVTGSSYSRYGGRALAVLVALVVAGAAVDPLSALGILVLGCGMTLSAATVRGEMVWSAGGLVYAALPGWSIALLRGTGDDGFLAIALLFLTIWATDSGAYFVGRTLGGPKLAPRISPKKTWSGAIGGTFVAVVAAYVFARVAGLPSAGAVAGVALVLSVVSQGGDLFESFVKRRFGVKDSGHIIPGHGGVMDRLDSLVTAGVAAAAIGWYRGGFADMAGGLLRW